MRKQKVQSDPRHMTLILAKSHFPDFPCFPRSLSTIPFSQGTPDNSQQTKVSQTLQSGKVVTNFAPSPRGRSDQPTFHALVHGPGVDDDLPGHECGGDTLSSASSAAASPVFYQQQQQQTTTTNPIKFKFEFASQIPGCAVILAHHTQGFNRPSRCFPVGVCPTTRQQ